jgi:RHS repeat-associated protein
VAGYRYDDRGLRIASYPPLPDINVDNYPTGSSADITAGLQSPAYKTFTLRNLGQVALNIIGIDRDGTDMSMFTVTQAPATPVPPGQSTQFTVQFLPTSAGNKTARLLIASNDPDENPYVINLRGFCEPEIQVGECGNGGTYDFGTVNVGEFESNTFNLDNLGTATLVLDAWPVLIDEQGGEQNFYLEDYSGESEILVSGHNTFMIRFAPMSEGVKTATVTIWNNDLDENPYTIYLTGTGLWGPEKIIEDETELTLLSPNGGESLEAGAIREILWKGGKRAEAVKLEYSTDNGSSYQTIIDRAANVGSYPWLVPQDLSGSCLVRISDADGSPTIPAVFAFEFNFRLSVAEGESLPDSHFVFRAGVPDLRTQTFQVAEVAFSPDGVRGSENLLFNHALGEVQELDRFLGRWHHARITYDMTNYTGAVWIDNQPIVAGVPLKADLDVLTAPEVSLSRGPEVLVELWIDDMDVRFVDLSQVGQDQPEFVFRPLFRDNFNRYESALFPRAGGWIPGLGQAQGGEKRQGETVEEGTQAMRAVRTEETALRSGVDDQTYASSAKSFKVEGSEEEPGTVTKSFSLPERIPFSVSAENFSIIEAGGEAQAERATKAELKGEKGKEGKRQKRGDGSATDTGRRRAADRRLPESMITEARSIRQGVLKEPGDVKMLSGALPNGTYYIYSFDWRLLAEYNVFGHWVRDYVYFGGQLVAEYRATEQGSKYYYYASDQINSTRIVTDNTGAVVYSAAHEPYGGIQKTWTADLDPELKFSGKPRDAESELDYFGARYYDRAQYRFISVDPFQNQMSDLYEQHSSNRYAYCGNNPLIYIDQQGKWKRPTHYNVTYTAMMIAYHDYDAAYADEVARLVATVCAAVDELSTTRSMPFMFFCPGTGTWGLEFPDEDQRKEWHFPDTIRFDEAMRIVTSTTDFIEFGKALHVVQDHFSHYRYDSGHAEESIIAMFFGGADPDNPLDFWDEALFMAYLTLDLCEALEQRRRAAGLE